MKKLNRILKNVVVSISLILIANLSFAGNDKAKKIESVVFKVEMDCMGCVNKLKKNIPFEKGVKELKIELEKKKVSIKYKADKTTKEKLQQAIEKLNFKVEEIKP